MSSTNNDHKQLFQSEIIAASTAAKFCEFLKNLFKDFISYGI